MAEAGAMEMPADGRRARRAEKRRIGREASPATARLLQVCFLVGFLGLWELASRTGVVNPLFISSPSEIVQAAYRLFFTDTQIYHDLKVSGIEYLIGAGLACVVGICIGLLIGYSRLVAAVAEPFLVAMSATPVVALLPLFLAWFGVGLMGKVALIFTGTVVVVAINTASGVRSINKNWTETARVFLASKPRLFLDVILPASVPFIVVGLRLGLVIGIVFTFVAELYSGNEGLGHFVVNAGQTFRIDELFVGVAVMAIAGTCISFSLLWLEKGPLSRFGE